MKDTDRQTRSHLMRLFDQNGFHPRTDLGQNFLIDLNLVEFLVTAGELTAKDVVLEVGTGTGGLTTGLAQNAGAVVSVEYDRHMHTLAKDVLADLDNVRLIQGDALRNKNRFSDEVLATVEQELAAAPERRLKLVANLPYNIATPVISNLVATELPWALMVVTIQWELAQRMTARPGRSQFGSLSAWLQSQCHVKTLKRLQPTVFWPRPKVNSAIVRIAPAPRRREQIDDRPFFHDFLRRLFHQRRKRMRTVLVGMYRKQLPKSVVDHVLTESQIAETARAEEIDVSQLVRVANLLNQAIASPELTE